MMNELTPDIAAGFKEARRNQPRVSRCTVRRALQCTVCHALHHAMHHAMHRAHAPCDAPCKTRRVPQACFAIFGGGPFISEIQLAAQVRGPRTYLPLEYQVPR